MHVWSCFWVYFCQIISKPLQASHSSKPITSYCHSYTGNCTTFKCGTLTLKNLEAGLCIGHQLFLWVLFCMFILKLLYASQSYKSNTNYCHTIIQANGTNFKSDLDLQSRQPVVSIIMVNVLKFCMLKFLTNGKSKQHRPLVRLHLKELSNQGLHCLPLH